MPAASAPPPPPATPREIARAVRDGDGDLARYLAGYDHADFCRDVDNGAAYE